MMVDCNEVILDGFFPHLPLGISQSDIRSELDDIPSVLVQNSDIPPVAVQNSDESTGRSPPVAVPNTENTNSIYLCDGKSPFCGFNQIVDAEYPEYITLQSRIDTFSNWNSENISVNNLAEAGFVYSGKADIAVCFHCGVHVGNWLPGEDAWVSHAKFAPWCTFLYIRKGFGFIDACTGDQLLQVQSSPIIEPDNDRYKCKICLEKEIGVCFFPCDHAVTCVDCAPGITSCPICREKITGVIRLKLIN
ncbi:death-associated inhibitor of apoptosis 2-like [Tetranychus urticae]|uniref:RING-type domain-containing protein n=1 Tax=Tetranychus urticae TaxID=32264 RepID=T1K794_TETUR|nr:death-associated inhibitor of apoptosis 2-like [Tetranychus urticae]